MIRNRTAILALLTALNFLNYIDRMILAAVLPSIIKEFGLDEFQAGMLATAFLIGYFATSPLFGARADKGTRKGLIAIGVVVWSLATVATGMATGLASLIVMRVLVGIGEASYATLAPTIIDDLTPPDRKGKALAIFYLAIPLGSAMGYLIGGHLDKNYGWRTAFYVAGGPGIVLALTCLLIVEPQRKLAKIKVKLVEGLRIMAKIPLFRRAVLGYCAYTAAIGAFSFWAPTFLIRLYPKDLDKESANFWFGVVILAAGAVGTLVGGQWADRSQRGLPAIVEGSSHETPENRAGINALLRICSIGMMIAAPLTVVAFFMPTPATFFVFVFFIGFGLFLSTSPINAAMLRAVPTEMRASAMAAGIFAIHLFGDLWSPPLLGLVVKYAGLLAAMLGLAVVFATSAATWWPRAHEAGPARPAVDA